MADFSHLHMPCSGKIGNRLFYMNISSFETYNICCCNSILAGNLWHTPDSKATKWSTTSDHSFILWCQNNLCILCILFFSLPCVHLSRHLEHTYPRKLSRRHHKMHSNKKTAYHVSFLVLLWIKVFSI